MGGDRRGTRGMLALHVAALHGHYQCTRELAHAKEDEDEVAVYINTLDNDQRSCVLDVIAGSHFFVSHPVCMHAESCTPRPNRARPTASPCCSTLASGTALPCILFPSRA